MGRYAASEWFGTEGGAEPLAVSRCGWVVGLTADTARPWLGRRDARAQGWRDVFEGALADPEAAQGGRRLLLGVAGTPAPASLVWGYARAANAMGAHIEGGGTSLVRILGVEELHPVEHEVVADRLEAGTYAVAGAITGGDVTITGCHPGHEFHSNL